MLKCAVCTDSLHVHGCDAFKVAATPRKPAIRYVRTSPLGLPPLTTPPEGETPPTVPFEVVMPAPRSAECFGTDDGYQSPRHMLDTAEKDALKDQVSRLHGAFQDS